MQICGKEINENEMVLVKSGKETIVGFIRPTRRLTKLFGFDYALRVSTHWASEPIMVRERQIESIEILIPKKDRKQREPLPEIKEVTQPEDGGA